jgi:hypothetical protein
MTYLDGRMLDAAVMPEKGAAPARRSALRYARVVVRFPIDERDALDRLRDRYFDDTGRGLSRASVVRVLVHRALDGADAQKAADVLGEPERTLAPRSVSIPARRLLAPTTRDDASASGSTPSSTPLR